MNQHKASAERKASTDRKASAEYVTGVATGWPEDRPDLLVLSLTTASGTRDFAMSKDQALLVAKTIKDTTAALKTGPQTSNDAGAS